MIKITDDAAQLLASARDANGLPEEYGVRFYVVQTPEQGQAVAFDFVESPEPQDDVVEHEGIPLFIEHDLATIVGDSVIEARQEDGETQLVLHTEGQRTQ